MALQGLFYALMQGRAMAGKRGKNGRDSASLQAGGKKWQIVTKDGSSCPSRRKQVAVRKLFTKSSQRSLDDKGRLMLPAAFREALTAESGGTFWLTCLYGRLVAYLPDEWDALVEELYRIPAPSPALVRFCAKVVGLAEELSCNRQGRVRIPQPLLKEAGIAVTAGAGAQVMVIGMYSRFEIWDLERFNAIDTGDVSAELAAKGLSIGL